MYLAREKGGFCKLTCSFSFPSFYESLVLVLHPSFWHLLVHHARPGSKIKIQRACFLDSRNLVFSHSKQCLYYKNYFCLLNPSSLKMNTENKDWGAVWDLCTVGIQVYPLVYLQSCGSPGRIKQGLFTQHLSLHNTQLLPNLNFSFTACPSSDPSFHFPVLTSYPECLLSGIFLFATPWTVASQAPLSTGISQARILE